MSSVYALGDPRTGEIRYIGIAKDVYRRYAQHLNNPHANGEKNTWMDDIKGAGLLPTLLILEADVEEVILYERERYWIAHYLKLDAPLTNMVLPLPEKEPPDLPDEEVVEKPVGNGTIHLRVREVASAKGLSMSKVSRLSDIDLTTLRKIYQDNANITMFTLDRLAQALQVDARELLNYTLPIHAISIQKDRPYLQ